METNVGLVKRFYEAFGRLDHAGMNELYDPGVIFFDPVFGMLNADQVKAMWQMLCSRAVGFRLEAKEPVALDDEYVTCEWTAEYVFSATGKKVVNRVKAHMRLRDGRITEHSDAFSPHRWAAQALGWKGWLLGGFGFFQRALRKKAARQLDAFMGVR